MNTPALWYLLIGALLLAMLLGHSALQRLPLTPAMLYLGVGVLLGPAVLDWLRLDLAKDAGLIQRAAEIAVLVSLFTSGLKLRAPLTDASWRLPLVLATASMAITVGLIAFVGVALLHLSLGAAILLGAILAPTDPVLASGVQVREPHDRDRLRFALTGEAGMNDGTAFPFVMLGLGLLGAQEFSGLGHWLLFEGLWKTGAGLGVGFLCGKMVTRLVLRLRTEHRQAVGLDDFLALGMIALSYGLAELVHGWGFLAVFAAGVAMRATERQHSGPLPVEEVKAAAEATERRAATDRRAAPAYLAGAVLSFNEQLDRIAELTLVVLVGALLSAHFTAAALWLAPLLFLVIRPLAVLPFTFGWMPRQEATLIAWFGIRGIGSIYYLAFALTHGLRGAEAALLTSLTITIVALSIVAHGVSVDVLMLRRARAKKLRQPDAAGSATAQF